MKFRRILTSLVFLLAVAGTPVAWGKDAPATAAQLLQEYTDALKAKDKAAILALYNWEGVAPADRTDPMIDDLLTREVKDVSLGKVATNYPTSFTNGDTIIHLNVHVVGSINSGFTDGFGVAFPYGSYNGACYIAGVITEKIPRAAPDTNQTITIRVQTPDGRSLPNVNVSGGTPQAVPMLHVKAIYGRSNEFRSAGDGLVHLPLSATNLYLVAADDDGFGWLPNAGLTNGAALVLQPWGRLTGVRQNRDHVLADEPLRLTQDRDYYGREVPDVVDLSGYETRTDSHGHFTFAAVPPLKLSMQQGKTNGDWDYLTSVDIKPGEIHPLDVSTRGRTVSGRVSVAPGLTNVDLRNCSATFFPTQKGATSRPRSFNCSVSAGSLRADGVEPGNYKISGSIRSGYAFVAEIVPITVTIPDDTSAAVDAPYDIGTVTLKAAINLQPGDRAPDFAVQAVTGEPLKLSELRGKYVLLDFWATWCGPCVGETPSLKATYDAYGKDPRFTMISLSLDATAAAPLKFARSHDIAWTQGFLGDWSDDKVTPTYGVHGIPAIFLLAPDGRIIATDMRGTKIKEAVGSALGQKKGTID